MNWIDSSQAMQISFPALSCGIVVASRRGLIGCR